MTPYMIYDDYNDNHCDNHCDQDVELKLHLVRTITLKYAGRVCCYDDTMKTRISLDILKVTRLSLHIAHVFFFLFYILIAI